jgi:hypothetical protein
MFASAPRGKFRELRLRDGGGRVAVRVRGCRVVWAPSARGGFATLDCSADARGLAVLRLADDEIRRLASPRFTPLRESGRAVVVKLARGLAWPADAERVDVVLAPGPFGAFGYCLTVDSVDAYPASGAVELS